MNSNYEKGNIYIVSTPIGNLKDITLRAIEVLQKCKYIFCEDTRTSKILMKNYNIHSKLISLHKFNESSQEINLRKILESGEDLAIISDAGTPLISDPGQLVLSKLKNEFKFITIPGANAITSALTTSGLVFDSFGFFGFIPREANKVKTIIEENLNIDLIIFYESPKRIKQTLENIKTLYGNIEVTIARELTKIYEENETLLISNWLERDEIKGEIVLIINLKKYGYLIEHQRIVKILEEIKDLKLSNKTITNLIKSKYIKKNEIYKMYLEINSK